MAKANLALDPDQLVEHLVGGGDDPRRRRIGPLGEDHVGELGTEVDGGVLERAGVDRAGAAGLGYAQDGRAGGVGRDIDVAGLGRKAVEVGEGDQRDLVDRQGLTIVEQGNDEALVADADTGEGTELDTVLVDEGDVVGARELGHPVGQVHGAEIERDGAVEGAARPTVDLYVGNIKADVAVYRIDGSVHFTDQTIWQYAHVDFSEVNCTGEVLREYQLGPGDDIFSVGRFVDIHGGQQNTPLIRSGIIASKGLVSVRTDSGLPWGEEECWIVEMRSRTGFSGSPVYAYIPPWQADFIEAPKRKYGNFFYGPWLLGIHSSQIPGGHDERSAGSGMVAVVPCSALEELLMRDDKVRQERAAYEDRFVDAPTAMAESMALPTKADNPQHREDFNRLLDAAVAKKEPSSET